MHGSVPVWFLCALFLYISMVETWRDSPADSMALRSKAATPNREVDHAMGAMASKITQSGGSTPSATAFASLSLYASELNRARCGQEAQPGSPYRNGDYDRRVQTCTTRNRASVRYRGRFSFSYGHSSSLRGHCCLFYTKILRTLMDAFFAKLKSLTFGLYFGAPRILIFEGKF